MSHSDETFERIVKIYLDAGMPAKHGMTPDEYRNTCLCLWNDCKTEPQYPNKLLIDQLYHEGLRNRWFEHVQYVDPRARAAVDVVEMPNEPIYCMAVGHISLAQWLTNSEDSAGSLSNEESDVDDAAADLDLCIIAVLDILGFEQMYRTLGPYRLQRLYSSLIERARSSTDVTAVGMSTLRYADGTSPTLFHFEVGFAYFSDTILLWAPLTPNHVSPFLIRCADVVLEAMKLGVPIRGAISVGEAVLDKATGTFLGAPLIEAARLEHAQDWLGVALGKSCSEICNYIDSSLVLPYTPPCKTSAPILHSGLALDWPRRARQERIDPIIAITSLNHSPNYAKYYENAAEFVLHSDKWSDWNRDHRIPITMGAIQRAVLGCALDGVALGDEIESMLDSLSSNGLEESAVAKCFRALARCERLPAEAAALPDGPRDMLTHLQGVIQGEFVDIDEMIMAVLEAGSGVRQLSERQKNLLNSPPSPRNQTWQSCIPLLQAAAEKRPIPVSSPDLPAEVAKHFESLRHAAEQKIPAIDMERLVGGVLWANATGSPLDAYNQRRLKVMEATGALWIGVAAFLKAVASRAEIDPELAGYDVAALSTVKVVEQILAWQQASRRSTADAIRDLGGCSVSARELAAVLTGLRDNVEFPLVLEQLRNGGSPHDAVARYIAKLAANDLSDVPGGVAEDAAMFLTIAQSVRSRTPMEFPIDHLAIAAMRGRTGTGLPLYDEATCLFFSECGIECREIATFLQAIAHRDPIPSLSDVISEPLRSQLLSLATHVSSTPEEAETDITAVGKAVLQARLGLGTLESKHYEFLAEAERHGESYAATAAFLKQLALPEEEPELPSNVPAHLRDYLVDLRVRALCRVEELDFQTLTDAAVSARLSGTVLRAENQKILLSMERSGSPYREVAQYIAELSKRGSQPKMPADIPLRVFGFLAVARRKAATLDRTIVPVVRTRDPL